MVNKCLNCGAEIIQKNGGKERKFCDNLNKCKQAYFNKNKKPKKYVQYKTFQELKEKFDEVVSMQDIKKELLPDMVKAEIGTKKFMEEKPKKLVGESGIDYSIRLAEWKATQKKI